VSDDSRLTDLVSLWLRHFSEGRDIPAEELCRGEADLVPALERRIELMRKMEQLAAKDVPKTPPLGGADPHEITRLQSTFPMAPADGAPRQGRRRPTVPPKATRSCASWGAAAWPWSTRPGRPSWSASRLSR